MPLNKTLPLLLAVAFSAAAGTASAAAGRWDATVAPGTGNGATSATPWIAAPAAGSVYAEWNFMGDDDPSTPLTVEDSTPDIGAFGLGSTGAVLRETTGGAFVTGGGNIYSPMVALAFEVTTPSPTTGPVDVWLRVSTIGSELETAATLNGMTAIAESNFTLPITGGFGGDENEWLWRWTLSSAPASLNFAFEAAASSVSLDQVAVYAVPVPEPETYALMALGLGALALRARRRNAR